MKIQYENEFVQNLGIGDPIKCVHQFIYDENVNGDMNIIQFLLCMDLDY